MDAQYAEGAGVPNLNDRMLEKVVWLKPEEIDVEALIERDHTDVEIDRFQQTIHDYQGALPIVIGYDCEIVAGRGRAEAGVLLGVDEIPAIPLTSMSRDDLYHYIETVILFGAYVDWTAEMPEIDLQHLLAIEAIMKSKHASAATISQSTTEGSCPDAE